MKQFRNTKVTRGLLGVGQDKVWTQVMVVLEKWLRRAGRTSQAPIERFLNIKSHSLGVEIVGKNHDYGTPSKIIVRQ